MKMVVICGALTLITGAMVHEADAAASAKAKQNACVADALATAHSTYPQSKLEFIEVSDFTNSAATFHNVTIKKTIGHITVKFRYICREEGFDAVSIVRREVID